MSVKPAEVPWPPISSAEAADGRDADAGASLALSVVVPAYNEGGRLGSTLPCLLRFLEDFRPDSEVIVVDDGSRDETARVLTGRLFNRAVTRLLVPGIRDSQCGFKGFRREAAAALFGRTWVRGFGFDLELLFAARRLGLVVQEVPVRWRDDARSTVRPLRDGLRVAAEVAKILAAWAAGRYRP